MIKKTYGLVRISSHSQNEKNGGTGVEFQTKKLNQYAELNDYEIGEIFVDEVSGTIADRDGIRNNATKRDAIKLIIMTNAKSIKFNLL